MRKPCSSCLGNPQWGGPVSCNCRKSQSHFLFFLLTFPSTFAVVESSSFVKHHPFILYKQGEFFIIILIKIFIVVGDGGSRFDDGILLLLRRTVFSSLDLHFIRLKVFHETGEVYFIFVIELFQCSCFNFSRFGECSDDFSHLWIIWYQFT